MGSGGYSLESRSYRAASAGYHTKSASEIFTQSEIHKEMDPKNFKKREARDNADHPLTIPVILGLDFTGSMGQIPHDLIKDGLPTLMGSVIENGAKDATICFVAIGDHKCDRCPIQMGQFEASDEALDMWLERSCFNGVNGGGNGGESYMQAWYLAAKRTSIDSMEKRGIKGLLITIGDENNHGELPASSIEAIFGDRVERSLTSQELLKEAQQSWEVYHLELGGGSIRKGWQDTLGEKCIPVDDFRKVPQVIADIIVNYSKQDVSSNRIPADDEQEEVKTKKQEIIL